jgi:hypothetical protein
MDGTDQDVENHRPSDSNSRGDYSYAEGLHQVLEEYRDSFY